MKDIVGIYIIDKKDEAVFVYEPHTSDEFDFEVLFDTLVTLDKMANELEGELNRVTLGEFVYFFIHEEVSKYKFVVKCTLDMERLNVKDFIHHLRELFLVQYRGFRVFGKKNKKALISKFKKDVEEAVQKHIVGPSDLLKAI